MNEIDLIDFLKLYENDEIIFVPNPGNSGDFLITYVTISLLKKFFINFTLGDCKKKYRNKTLFFGGGGNVSYYKDFRNFFILNRLQNKIIILPHTFYHNEDIISQFNENNIILCREITSYNHVKSINKNNHKNIYLCHDVAFYIDKKILESFITDNISLEKTLYCFRTDRESKQNEIPSTNQDLSLTTYECNDKNIFFIYENVVKKFIKEISKYENIYTDRLHVAIISCLLNKQVHFYANSYFKNESVYFYSMKNRENIKFFDVFEL